MKKIDLVIASVNETPLEVLEVWQILNLVSKSF